MELAAYRRLAIAADDIAVIRLSSAAPMAGMTERMGRLWPRR
jgi:hypothetical protein